MEKKGQKNESKLTLQDSVGPDFNLTREGAESPWDCVLGAESGGVERKKARTKPRRKENGRGDIRAQVQGKMYNRREEKGG